jgi:hypothetical protein
LLYTVNPVADYNALYRKLAQEIQKQEGKIGADSAAFVSAFVTKLRANGWKIDADQQNALNAWLSGTQASIATAIEAALTVTASAGVLSSAKITELSTEAFARQWPDGLNLSERLWNWDNGVKAGLTKTLNNGIALNQGVGKTLYDMQRVIEREHGQRFKLVEHYKEDWVKELHAAGQAMINNPDAKVLWNRAVGEAIDRIDALKVTGTKRAAERVLSQMQKAIAKGSEALLDNAAKWWLYDKQLYHLQRIVRTEMANAGHRAVIASADGDESIIGFQWRLSGSHPTTDICDYYANVELGFGKGVFPKDQVPTAKAHPHCMCLLIPRVTPIKERGTKNYAQFLQKLPKERLGELLPKWASEQVANGKPLTELIRKDGKGLVLKRDFLEQQIAHIERLPYNRASQAAQAIVAGKSFIRFAEGNGSGYYPVAVVTGRVQATLGSSVKTVRLSAVDRDKQVRKGSEQGRNQYAMLQTMIETGETIQYRERAVSVYLQINEYWHHAALQATKAGDEIYLKSLRRSDVKQLERDRFRGKVIGVD